MTRALRLCAIAAAAGAAGCTIGLLIDGRTTLVVYLAAAVTVISVPMGALGALLLTYLVPGRWTGDLYPPLSRAALLLPLAGLLLVPALIGLGHIYPWVHERPDERLFQSVYLTPWFFILRTVIYFAVLSVLAFWAARAYGREAEMTRAASGGIIVYALIVSFAGVDWLESIEPHFHSSIYGLLFLVAVILAGFAFGLLAVLTGRHRAPAAVYGGILFSVLLSWAYDHAMQYIIIWSGNIPGEAIWYTERLRGGWGIALWSLYILQFIAPFFALLSERVRNDPNSLLVIAGGTLALRYLEIMLLVVPAVTIEPWLLLLAIPSALLLTGGLFLVGWLLPVERMLTLVVPGPTSQESRSSRRARARSPTPSR